MSVATSAHFAQTRSASEAAEPQASVKDFVVRLEVFCLNGHASFRSDSVCVWCWGLRLVSSFDHGIKGKVTGAPSTPPAKRNGVGGLDVHNHSPGKPRQPLGLLLVQPWRFHAHRHASSRPLGLIAPPRSSHHLFSGDDLDRPPERLGLWMDSGCPARGRRRKPE